MTTYTIYADEASDYVLSLDNATYANARNGTGVFINVGDESTLTIGQDFSSGLYFVDESFVNFDTSGVSGTVSSADLSLVFNSNFATTSFTIEARIKDWGASLTTADWVPGGSLSGLTLAATLASNDVPGPDEDYYTFTNVALEANINQAGTTGLVLASDRTRTNTTPTNTEYLVFYSADAAGTTQDPKLVVTASASSPQTLTGTLFTDTDSFGAGKLSLAMAGTLFSDADSFGAGSVLRGGVNIAGTLFSDTDSFGAGKLNLLINGTLFSDTDSFGAGTVLASSITIGGTLFTDTDSFGAGLVSVGPISITGTLFSDADSFGAGVVSQDAYAIKGILYTNNSVFFAGYVEREFRWIPDTPNTGPWGASSEPDGIWTPITPVTWN